jgi:hypothetical protein
MRMFHTGPDLRGECLLVDMPIGEAAKKSSSHNLSIFSYKADFEGAEVVTATHKDSSSSVRELWPDIDKLDTPSHEGTSVVRARNALTRGKLAFLQC